MLKINIITTDKDVCFISDCMELSGYDFDYHTSKIIDYLFDGEKPVSTYYKNWYKINKYPKIVQYLKSGEEFNKRFELKDKEMVSDKLPLSILLKDIQKLDEHIIECLYVYKYDIFPDTLENVECEFIQLCNIENYIEPPIFNYKGICKDKYNISNEIYSITNINIEHSFIHKIFTPTPVLSSMPCRLSSKEMYDIIRQYIKDNIDLKVAKITSDYDFCFTVKKIIPLIEPETITYNNFFAKTKKERDKIHYSISKYSEKEIFQMTHTQENYRGYTPIQAFEAENEWALKEKIDNFLKDLITVINKPLKTCPYCKGGYIEDNTEEA